jgi:hypothetical protein
MEVLPLLGMTAHGGPLHYSERLAGDTALIKV